MKKIFLACFAATIFLSACDNSGSSTVGTYEHDDDTTQTMQMEDHPGHGAPATENKMEQPDSMKPATSDTSMVRDTTM